MKKCLNCPICPFVQSGSKAKSTATNDTVDINCSVDCQTANIIYLISCKKCPDQYVGQSERTLQERFSEHKGYVINGHTNKATGHHFNQRGHSVSDMAVTILEKVHIRSEPHRKEREKMYIQKMNTQYKGMNRQN